MYELSEMEKSDSVSYQIVYICKENFHNNISDVSVGVMSQFSIKVIQINWSSIRVNMQVISETSVFHKPYASKRNSTIVFQIKSANDISSLFDM